MSYSWMLINRASAPHSLRLFVQSLCLAAVLGAFALKTSSGRDYTLAPGDRITVTVFGQPELSGDLVVDGAGYIVIPFVDPIEVKGLTPFESQNRIRDRLSNGILQQP